MLLTACFAGVFVACKKKNVTYEVIFFDVENSPSGRIHYDGEVGFQSVYYDGVKPSDCYMVKAGDTEILVDAGFEVTGDYSEKAYERIANVYRRNILPQIKKYCKDGVLEYMIITHGDFDHIAGCAADGGLLDYFYEDNKLSLETIIDFDGDLTQYLCNPNGNEIFPSGENRLITTVVADTYRTKRDKLVNDKGVKHVPAAQFFKGTDFLQENTLVNAMPSQYLKQYFQLDAYNQLTDEVNTDFLTNFYYFANGTIEHQYYDTTTQQVVYDNYTFKSNYNNLNANLGQLKSQNDRYYYSIKLKNGVELRILYNWFYDHFYRHSFNAQDRNNICVCFEVVDKYNNKFVSFGDLGTGEDGLINYYGETDVLKGVTCFKASHHGSTHNGENSQALYQLMTPEIVVVPGVAQISRELISESDPIYELLSGAAVMKSTFFDNITAANPNVKIYCTQIAKMVNSRNSESNFTLMAGSFYGNIYVEMSAQGASTDCSHKGKVVGYVSSNSENSKAFKFKIRENGSLLSFNETEYWKAIYVYNGIV